MYQPKYAITNKLLKSINRIIEANSLIVNAPLKPKWEAGLRHQALVRSVHRSWQASLHAGRRVFPINGTNPLASRQVIRSFNIFDVSLLSTVITASRLEHRS